MADLRHAVPRSRAAAVVRAMMRGETGGGVALMIATVAAITVANSALAPVYFAALKTVVGPLSVLHWINDALMAVFFLLVGLEIKREFIEGQLSTWPRRVLPVLAAAGGMIVPALIYVSVNIGSPATLRGWAIPTATDIAFALGVLALLGPRVPVSLKIFLTALAIIDDLGAVAIIAAFYTADLSLPWLGAAIGTLAGLAVLNRLGFVSPLPYVALGLVLWFFVLRSGVHATLAGVALALTVPLRLRPAVSDTVNPPLVAMEHALHPWVALLVVPVFGFANAGVSLAGIDLATLLQPVPLGIGAGLFFGKLAGVFLTTAIAVRAGLADKPDKASWTQILGVALLCGIGFTMSLFIGLLAFPDAPALQDQVKIGVLMGSLVSGLVGAMVLLVARREDRPVVAG